MARKLNGIELTRYDDLFKTDEERSTDRQERVQIVPAEQVFPYARQPYSVDRPSADLVRLMDSIERTGIAEPLIVRPRSEGGYEIISGHRRDYCAKVVGLDNRPVIVRNYSDEDADILVVDYNINRENLLPSEKARAYKAHLHNHVVVNSVSFVDGKKYHSSPGSYYFEVRAQSDALCRENDLSTIAPQGKGKHYAEWKAEQNGKPTIRSTIRADIDRIIGEAYTYDTFLMLLRRRGYVVQNNPNRKYVTVLPPGGKRAIRLDSLGDGYTEQDIRRRLAAQREGGAQSAPAMTRTGKRYRVRGKRPTGPKKKITGFQALYLRYLYLLRGTHRKKYFRRVPFSVRQEVVRLERYDRQFRYLWANGMTTAEDLEQRIAALEREIYDGEQQRKPLYRERRDAEDEAYKTQCSAEIDRQTAALREKRRELALCRRILEDVPLVSRQVQQAEAERREEMRKEAQKREYQR